MSVVLLAAVAALGGFTVGLAIERARVRRHRREVARARAEIRALEDGLRLFLAFRHRLATPLQILEISSALLRRRCSEAAAAVERMDGALGRLRELTGLLPLPGEPLHVHENRPVRLERDRRPPDAPRPRA